MEKLRRPLREQVVNEGGFPQYVLCESDHDDRIQWIAPFNISVRILPVIRFGTCFSQRQQLDKVVAASGFPYRGLAPPGSRPTCRPEGQAVLALLNDGAQVLLGLGAGWLGDTLA